MKNNLLTIASRHFWLTTIIVLGAGVGAGFGLFWSGIWGAWGEPVSWTVGLGIQACIILKGFQIYSEGQARMDKRSFEITLGLRQGYAPDALVYDGQEVVSVVKEWINIRLAAKLPILAGKFVYGPGMGLLYPLRNDPEHPENGQFAMDEPLFVYYGDLSPKYDAQRSDDEVILTLRDLAMHLGRRLNQKRMYYSYRGDQYAEDVS